MFKNLTVLGSTTVFVGVLLFGRDVASYLTASAGQLGETVRPQLPVELELRRADSMIADLTPQVRKSMHAIAREEIEIERLADRIRTLEDRQAHGQSVLSRLQQELDSGRDEIQIGSSRYTSAEAERLAEVRFERYKTDEITLGLLRRTSALRQNTLESARTKLDAMLAAKHQLVAEIANLRAWRAMHEVARSADRLDSDDLTRIRELLGEIETRIQVDQRIAEMESDRVDDLLPAEVEEQDDIAGRISAYFGDRLVIGKDELAPMPLLESL